MKGWIKVSAAEEETDETNCMFEVGKDCFGNEICVEAAVKNYSKIADVWGGREWSHRR